MHVKQRSQQPTRPPARQGPSSSARSSLVGLLSVLYLPRHTAVGSGPGQPGVKARLGGRIALAFRREAQVAGAGMQFAFASE